jgi:outer membrane receptor protein involved in Fe transport
MGFTRSNHVVLGYDLTFLKNFHFKTEVYFQYLDKVPVDPFSSSFSMLNAGSDFSTPTNTYLVNKGVGRNYGLELTLEKFFTKGYYFLFTTSLFESQYKGSDNVWRNTAFNGKYVVNGLGGYEYKFGGKKNKVKRNTIAADGKITVAGGRYYTPIDVAASAQQGQEVLLNNQAFSQQYPVYFRLDLKLSYRISLRKMTHEFSIDCQNVTNRKNVFIQTYDLRTNSLVYQYQEGIFPLPQYRLLF